jgi:hypothetical protein
MKTRLVALTVCAVGSFSSFHAQLAPVTIVRLPAGGLQPQVAVDAKGTAHVVYFVGEPANGDLVYVTLTGGTFSKPVRVNSEPGSAIATGTVRGAQIAVGRHGRIHVAWNGSGRATPKAPGSSTPMLYARLDSSRVAFEPQRNIVQAAIGLDGGGAIAADDRGRVFVAWHAGGPTSKGEGDRRVWLAGSTNDGLTFSREVPVSDPSTGACGCCGMDGLIDRTGSLFLLYRTARDVVHRDTYLLSSTDGLRFSSTKLQEWNIAACPMSTFSLAETSDSVIAAWETDGEVQLARIALNGVWRAEKAKASFARGECPRSDPLGVVRRDRVAERRLLGLAALREGRSPNCERPGRRRTHLGSRRCDCQT